MLVLKEPYLYTYTCYCMSVTKFKHLHVPESSASQQISGNFPNPVLLHSLNEINYIYK